MKETDLDLAIENDMQPTRAPRFLLTLVILTLLNTGLASDMSAYITGQTIHVCGGMLM